MYTRARGLAVLNAAGGRERGVRKTLGLPVGGTISAVNATHGSHEFSAVE